MEIAIGRTKATLRKIRKDVDDLIDYLDELNEKIEDEFELDD